MFPRRKFGNKRTKLAGRTFDSRLEAAVFSLLSLRERGGEICSLSHHPGTVFLTLARVQYRPDFRWEENGETRYGEAKGFQTPEWRIKRRLWQFYGPGPLTIWAGSAARITLIETIIPQKS